MYGHGILVHVHVLNTRRVLHVLQVQCRSSYTQARVCARTSTCIAAALGEGNRRNELATPA